MTRKRDRPDLRGADVNVLQTVALQSRDPIRVRRVLDPRSPLSAPMLPHVIPLLGVRELAGDAMRALKQVADHHPGAFIDALLDSSYVPAVRRRLARVLSACRSQVVADGLLIALDDAGVAPAASIQQEVLSALASAPALIVVSVRPTVEASFSIAPHTCERCSRSVPEPMCRCRPVTERP